MGNGYETWVLRTGYLFLYNSRFCGTNQELTLS